ncbi:signal peptidase II [bacterium]|nr:signal peptidase II [bacterium]MBU1982826.1 signal peptidase II [bacterium]
MSKRRVVWPWYATAGAVLALDQVTKVLVRDTIPLHESISLIGKSFLRLTHVQNPGVAFGIQLLGPSTLMVSSWIATVVLSIYLYTLIRRGDPLRWPIALFLTGAAGNSIDRLLFGTVTDFVDVDFPNFIMARWPVFNVADSCITIGITLLLFQVIFLRHPLVSPLETESHERSAGTSPSLPSDHGSRTTPVAD